MTDTLKPCPFCGSGAEVVHASHIRCINRYNCDGETRLGEAAWNRRALDLSSINIAFAAPDLHPYLQMALGNHTTGVFKDGKLIAADAQVYAEPVQQPQDGVVVPRDFLEDLYNRIAWRDVPASVLDKLKALLAARPKE